MAKNIESIDTGELVTAEVAERHLIPVLPESERVITSRFGYRLECKDYSGSWLPIIKTFNDDAKQTPVKTAPFFCGRPEIDRITSSLLTHLLKHYAATTVNSYAEGIWLVTSRLMQGEDVQEAILNAIADIKKDSDLTAIKRLGRYFLMYELDGYLYDFHQEIQALSRGGAQNAYMSYNLRDDEEGPFMREEMLVLNQALGDPFIHLEDRVLMGLMIEWGLRPIQVVLLKQSDFEVREIAGEALYRINVPRVKQGAKQRRQQFTKRPISRKLGEMIDELIQIHQSVYADLDIQDPPLVMRRYKLFAGNNPYQHKAPIKILRDQQVASGTWDVSFAAPTNIYQDVYDANNKSDMGHHVQRDRIQYRLDAIVDHLPRSPRTGQPFNLYAYRFRYTKGTTMVQEGYTPAEVADALDHSDTTSVRHYFRETAETNELVEEATNRRVEQGMWVAAWQRNDNVENNIYGEDVVELTAFTTVGKCKKGSPCWFEPAVACYGCDKFKPNTDAQGHKNALKRIETQIAELAKTTFGAASHQLDEARAGCMAAIAYAEGKQVVFIEDGTIATKDEVIGSRLRMIEERS
ncbi:site-specific integrase [Marinobacterium mangrovicola]|uniref:Phage integrase family protein n=1 Tax=Marinobacterium mangrovicola TaxID=1476959 RepID=A0A4R1HB77_9GAMM|nr:site-specific integrase [Marinobacterium mangrovicola]TCK16419.1 phage integrase family protein [Marinobacterium mangrovicola]